MSMQIQHIHLISQIAGCPNASNANVQCTAWDDATAYQPASQLTSTPHACHDAPPTQ